MKFDIPGDCSDVETAIGNMLIDREVPVWDYFFYEKIIHKTPKYGETSR